MSDTPTTRLVLFWGRLVFCFVDINAAAIKPKILPAELDSPGVFWINHRRENFSRRVELCLPLPPPSSPSSSGDRRGRGQPLECLPPP